MEGLKIKLPPSTSDIPVPIGITARFQVRYDQLNKPDGFGVYLSTDVDSRTLYVSPTAKKHSSELLRQLTDNYDISASDAPSRFAVEIVAGGDFLE